MSKERRRGEVARRQERGTEREMRRAEKGRRYLYRLRGRSK